MSSQNKRRLLLGGTLLTLFIILLVGWLLREPIQERVIGPIAERFWWWWRFAQAFLPQAVMWTLLIMIGGLRLAWFVASRTKLYSPDDVMPGKPGQVGNWLRLLHLSHRAQRLFVKPLRFLAVDIVAEAEQESRDVVFAQLHRQTLPLPKHLQTYLNKGSDNTPARLKAVSEVENLIKPKTVDSEVEELITELEHIMDTT